MHSAGDIMADRVDDDARVKTLVQPPADLQPRSIGRNILDRLWSAIVPAKMRPARPTVANPAAFPFGAVALLDFYKSGGSKPTYLGSATGFFLKHDVLVTAAHNLIYSGADMVATFPGWDDKLNRSAMVPALRWSQSSVRDVSVLITSPNAPMATSFGGLGMPSATLVGYAFNYRDGTKRMSSGAGQCQVHGAQCTYGIAAQQGDSGGPIFSSGNAAMALHTQLMPGPGGTMIGGGEAADAQFVSIVASLEAQARAG